MIHPDVAARFPMLDGLTSMREAYGTPAGLERIRAHESWEPEEAPPADPFGREAELAHSTER